MEETEQASEPDMAGILELSDWEFKATINNVLRALMSKVDSIQEQMGNVSRKIEILSKDQEEILEFSNIITEMKNNFDGLIRRLDITEERISELEFIPIEISKSEKQREQRLKKKSKQHIQEFWDHYKRCNIHIMGIPEGEERD